MLALVWPLPALAYLVMWRLPAGPTGTARAAAAAAATRRARITALEADLAATPAP